MGKLKQEYNEDNEEKDRQTLNIFRNMKLLGEEARRREVVAYYNKCKEVYDLVYYDWRDLKRSYIDYEMTTRDHEN